MSNVTINVKNDAMLGRLNQEQLHVLLIEQQEEIERLKEKLKFEEATNKELMSTGAELENKLYEEQDKNKRLNNIINEVREWAKKCSCSFTNDDGELVVSEISFNLQARPCDLFKILDKEII